MKIISCLIFLFLSICCRVAFGKEEIANDDVKAINPAVAVVVQIPVSKCEPITNRFCQNLGQGYSKTIMPNVLGHQYQTESEIAMQEYSPLLQSNCSKYLRFFLCSVYSPFCSEHLVGALHSCRNLCQQVSVDCSTMASQKFDIPWSTRFNCSNFPEFKKGSLCMQFPKTINATNTILNTIIISNSGNIDTNNNNNNNNNNTTAEEKFLSDFVLADPFKRQSTYSSSTGENLSSTSLEALCWSSDNLVWEELSESCLARCDRDVFYSEYDKRLLNRWTFCWAIVCFGSTLFTLLTFCINRDRFNYPEQPIIYFVLCYNVISVLHLIRYAFGSEPFVCRHYYYSSNNNSNNYNNNNNNNNVSYLVADGLENPICTISFLLHYYLHASASVWWFVLSLSWYLSAAKKWSSEAISDWSSYFHCVAWSVPGLLAVLTLSLHNVSGDELTGLCRIAPHNSLMTFSVVPYTIVLASTCLVWLLTGSALTHVKNELNQSGRNVFKLQKLTTRLMVFQSFYIIPSIIVIVCGLYESFVQRPLSISLLSTDLPTSPPANSNNRHFATACSIFSVSNATNGGDGVVDDNDSRTVICNRSSDIEIALIKIFSQLFVGTMSGMWVWTQKTCHVWWHFIINKKKRKADLFLYSYKKTSNNNNIF